MLEERIKRAGRQPAPTEVVEVRPSTVTSARSNRYDGNIFFQIINFMSSRVLVPLSFVASVRFFSLLFMPVF